MDEDRRNKGRSNRGRRLEISLPTQNDLKKWKEEAAKRHVSLSKLVYELVESQLYPDRDPNRISSMSDDIIKLQAEVNRLRGEIKDKAMRLEQADTKLFNIDYRPFLSPDPDVARFSSELIGLLKSGGTWPGREILKSLHIDSSNADTIRIVSNQLNILQSFDLIEETPRGWRWVG